MFSYFLLEQFDIGETLKRFLKKLVFTLPSLQIL